VNQKNSGDIFDASASGAIKFQVANNGTVNVTGGIDTLTGTGLTLGGTNATSVQLGNGSAVTTAAGGLTVSAGKTLTVAGTSNQIVFGNGAVTGTLTWTPTSSSKTITLPDATGTVCLTTNNCGYAAGQNYWQLNAGAISPFTNTADLLLGATSTSSAKFAFIGVNTTSPVASISANPASAAPNGLSLAPGAIQSLNMNTLTIGGGTTGNVIITPDNGTNGVLTINAATTNFTGTATINATSLGAFNTSATLTLANTTTITANSLATLNTAGTLAINANTINFGNGSAGVVLGTTANQSITLTPNGTGQTFITSDADSGVAIGSGNTTAAPLVINGGIGSNGALIVNQKNSGDIFDASASGAIKFQLLNNGSLRLVGGQTSDIDTITGTSLNIGASTTTALTLGNASGTTTINGSGLTIGPTAWTATPTISGTITANGGLTIATGKILKLQDPAFTTNNNSVLYTDGSGNVNAVTTSANGQCLVSQTGPNPPLWATCPNGATQNYWQLVAGAISPFSTTADVLIGSTATASADFAFKGVDTTTPVASIAATTGTKDGLSLAATNSTIQSLNMNTLTLGGNTTGNIALASNNISLTGSSPIIDSTGTALQINTNGQGVTIGAGASTTIIGGSLQVSGNIIKDSGGSTTRIQFVPANGYVLLNPSSGNVGIGTATPTSLFSVGASSQFQINGSGNVISGTWQGTVIGAQYGGTGINTSASTGVPSISGGTWSVNATLPLSLGGTGSNLTANNGGIVWSNGSGLQVLAHNTNAGLALVSGGAATPSWFAPTQGSVLFAGANGALTQDNANLFWDDTNNRLGIGTTTPSQTLQLDRSSTSENGIIYSSSGTVNAEIGYAGTAAQILSDTTAGDLAIKSLSGRILLGAGTASQVIIDPTSGLRSAGYTVPGTGAMQSAGSGVLELTNTSNNDIGIYPNGNQVLTVRFTSGVGRVGVNDAAVSAHQFQVGASCTNVGSNSCADYAEYYNASEIVAPAQIVSLDPSDSTNKLVHVTTSAYDSQVIGIASTNPAYVIEEGDMAMGGETSGQVTPSTKPPVALAGRVPVMVSTINGSLSIGDEVTSSNLKGFGMKATRAGFVVGKAMQDFDPANGKVGQGVIDCPAGTPTGIVCGEIFVFTNASWYDPDVYLTDTGNLSIFESTPGTEDQLPTYGVTENGQAVHRVGAFSDALIGNIQAGLVQATNMIVGGKNVNDELNKIDNMASGEANLTSQVDVLNTKVASLEDALAGIQMNTASNGTSGQEPNGTGTSSLALDNTQTNPVANPGAEQPLDLEWTTSGYSTIQRVTTEQHTGSASIQVTGAKAGDGARNILSATLNPSTAYTISWYIKSGSTIPNESITAAYSYDGAEAHQTSVCGPLTSSTDSTSDGWELYSCQFTTTATTPTSSNAIFIEQTDSTLRTYYLDDVSLALTNQETASDTDSLQLSGASPSATLDASPSAVTIEKQPDGSALPYEVKDANGNVINKTGIFSEAAIGNLRTGIINAQNINTESLVIAGQNVNDRLNNLENTASNAAELTNKIDGLSSDMAQLKDKVASLEATFGLLASGSALLNGPTTFVASSAAEVGLDKLNANDVTISDSLSVLGQTTVADLGVTGRVTIGLLGINGLDQSNGTGQAYASINTSSGPLMIQPEGFNGVDFLNGKMKIDTKGDVNTQGAITANKINIDTQSVAGASLGQGTLQAGQTSVTINTTAVGNNSAVFITPKTKTAQPLSVTSQTAGKSFTVEIASPESEDIDFNWWIVN